MKLTILDIGLFHPAPPQSLDECVSEKPDKRSWWQDVALPNDRLWHVWLI